MTISEGVAVDNAEPDITDDSQNSHVSETDSDQVQAFIDDDPVSRKRKKEYSKYPMEKNGPTRIQMVKKKETLTESESDLSDCNITCSLCQSGFTSHTYSMDDIKKFLKETKHIRNVHIGDFSPADLEQFSTKTRALMSDGCFTEQEVTKLNVVTNTRIRNAFIHQVEIRKEFLKEFAVVVGAYIQH